MDQNTDNPNMNPENPPESVPFQDRPPQSVPPQSPPPGGSDVPPPSQPQPVIELSKEAKQWGMFCHLAAFAGLLPIPFGNIIAPLVIWLIKREEFTFVDEQGKESLNFQISMTVYGILSGLLICIFIGFILLPAVIIANVIFVIMASIEANKGRSYRYPLAFRILK